jgi:hypothetical protein
MQIQYAIELTLRQLQAEQRNHTDYKEMRSNSIGSSSGARELFTCIDTGQRCDKSSAEGHLYLIHLPSGSNFGLVSTLGAILSYDLTSRMH